MTREGRIRFLEEGNVVRTVSPEQRIQCLELIRKDGMVLYAPPEARRASSFLYIFRGALSHKIVCGTYESWPVVGEIMDASDFMDNSEDGTHDVPVTQDALRGLFL